MTRAAALVRRFWPFLPTAGTTWVVWRVFRTRDLVADGTTIDHAILLGIAGAYLFAVVIMLAVTARWTWRGLGQTCTYLGDAGLYGGGALARLGWRHKLTTNEVNLILALLATGAILLVAGLLWWIKDSADERRETGLAAEAARLEISGWPTTNEEE